MRVISVLLAVFIVVVALGARPAKAQNCQLPEPCQCPCQDGAVAFRCTENGDFEAIIIAENPEFVNLPTCAPQECSGNFCVPCQNGADCAFKNDECLAFEQREGCTIRGVKYRCNNGDCICGRCFS